VSRFLLIKLVFFHDQRDISFASLQNREVNKPEIGTQTEMDLYKKRKTVKSKCSFVNKSMRKVCFTCQSDKVLI